MFLGSSGNARKDGGEGRAVWPDGESRDPERWDSWEMAQGLVLGAGLGVSRAWSTKARFQAWETPRCGERGVEGGGAESSDPGQGGEPQDGREEKGGPNSPA